MKSSLLIDVAAYSELFTEDANLVALMAQYRPCLQSPTGRQILGAGQADG
jgi:hypothetical protein